jgi:hypothetical protein
VLDWTSYAAPPGGLGRRAILTGMALPIDRREALRMLAGSPLGSTESIMMAHGFAIGTLQYLVPSGLATAERRSVPAGQRMIKVKWMEVTEAGRLALGG